MGRGLLGPSRKEEPKGRSLETLRGQQRERHTSDGVVLVTMNSRLQQAAAHLLGVASGEEAREPGILVKARDGDVCGLLRSNPSRCLRLRGPVT